MGDERIGQGKDSVKAYLQANPDIAQQVEDQVRENMGKLMGIEPKTAKSAERPIAVSADDFDDED
jgi:recombination protein RecA